MAATLKHYDKSDLHIRVRATVPENSSVVLEFLEFPKEEMELLYEIIKILGASGIGIAKAILEEHSEGHNALAQLLIEREVIFAEDVEKIFGKRPWASRSEEILNDEQTNETT